MSAVEVAPSTPTNRAPGAGDEVRSLDVALLTPTFWPEVRRGAERFVHELATGLRARGHSPRVLTSHPRPPSREVQDGMEVVRNWRPPDGRLLRRQYEDHLTHLPFSYLELLRGGADVAHAVQSADALAAVRWSRRTGRPAILSYMGVPTRPYLVKRRGRAEMLAAAARGCAAVTALSRSAAEHFGHALGIEARVIHPGVDVAAFTPGSSDEQRSAVPTIFCPSAVDQPFKRVDLLIAALAEVRRVRPTTRLILSRPHDEGTAARFALEGVDLVDVDAHAAMVQAYRCAWVTALPSRGDAFGLVLVESLACGTPVLGSDLGGIPEIVDRPDIGALFTGEEPRDVARGLLEAMELTEAAATPEACRRRALDFSTDRCAAAYEALYAELTGA